MRYGEWKEYVPVSLKKAQARSFADKIAKKHKRERQPIEIDGRKIAKSFWGKAWCDHLRSLSDYSNRLPRGGTYVRNGSVVDLVINPGMVHAVVAGSEPYEVSIAIKKLDKKAWDKIKKDCSSSIDSLIDLLGGRLSDGVMHRLTDKQSGCFPSARQIEMECDCPDWSSCCKHIAAVMYAIGSRLDSEPELLFLLRGVDKEELISQAVSKENLASELAVDSSDLVDEDLGAMFGIELDASPPGQVAEVKVASKRSKVKTNSQTKSSRPKVAAKKVAAKKVVVTKKKPVGKETANKVINKSTTKKKTAAAATSPRKKVGAKKKGVKEKRVKEKRVKEKVAVKKGEKKKDSNKQPARKKLVKSVSTTKPKKKEQAKNKPRTRKLSPKK